MRILLVNNLYSPYAKGGAERVVTACARQFRQEGHEVHIATTAPMRDLLPHFFQKITEEDGVIVHRFAPTNIWPYARLSALPRPLRFLWHLLDGVDVFGYWLLRRMIARLQPDIVYTHNLKGMGLPMVRSCQYAKQHVHALHDVQLITPSGLIWHGKESSREITGRLARLYRAWCRWLFKYVRHVEAPTQWIIAEHRRYGFFVDAVVTRKNNATAVQDLPHGRGEVFGPTGPPARRTHVADPNEQQQFLFVGQIEKHKGIDFLLHIFEKVVAQWHDAHVHVVGDGSELQSLREQYRGASWTTFHGRLDTVELSEMYRYCDALIVPSLCYENAPTVIHEAHAHGMRVIASDLGGIPELLREGDCAVLPGEADMWIHALRSFIRACA